VSLYRGRVPENIDDRTRLAAMLRGYQITQLLYVCAELGVPDRLADGPLAPAELAAAVDADPDAFARILEPLRVIGVLDRDATGAYGLTPLGTLLRSDIAGSLRPGAVSCGQDWWWRPWGNLLTAVRTGTTAFDGVFGEPLYAYLRRDPAAAAVFNAHMTSMSGASVSPLVDALDLAGPDRLVDVGGGHGVLGAAILARHPRTEVVVYDRPDVVATMPAVAATEDGGSLTPVGGDFFVDVPAGADAYVIKDVLHNWTDDECRAILRNIRAAAPDHARLHLIERVLDPDQTEYIGAAIDVMMLVLTSGRERSIDGYAALLADSGWSLTGERATGTVHSVLTAVPA
jgi:hypothetical protein